MKIKAFRYIRYIIFISIMIMAYHGHSQTPPPPGGGSSGSENTDDNRNGGIPGGGAPIGSGMLLLIGLGSTYAGYKGYKGFSKRSRGK